MVEFFLQKRMGAHWAPVVLFTAFWGIIGGILPFFVSNGPNKRVIQLILVMTAVCCWLFWLCCYMAQMNPLIGPNLNQKSLFAIKRYWNGWNQSYSIED